MALVPLDKILMNRLKEVRIMKNIKKDLKGRQKQEAPRLIAKIFFFLKKNRGMWRKLDHSFAVYCNCFVKSSKKSG